MHRLWLDGQARSVCGRLARIRANVEPSSAWNLNTGQPVMVYKKHSAIINAVRFVPFASGNVRYLVSTGNDCNVVFYPYNIETLQFE